MSKRVLNLLDGGFLRLRKVAVKRITVIEFGVMELATVQAVVESR